MGWNARPDFAMIGVIDEDYLSTTVSLALASFPSMPRRLSYPIRTRQMQHSQPSL